MDDPTFKLFSLDTQPGSRLDEAGGVVSCCFHCSAVIRPETDFTTACPKCGAALHCCKQCIHFEPSTRFQCTKPIPARIPYKDQPNSCELFSPPVTLMRTERRRPAASASPPLAIQRLPSLNIDYLHEPPGPLPDPTKVDLLRRYLLGELPEKERSELEELYFSDNSVFTLLSVVEDELVDDYVRGVLQDDRERFERNYLNSEERRRRVQLARDLLSIARTDK